MYKFFILFLFYTFYLYPDTNALLQEVVSNHPEVLSLDFTKKEKVSESKHSNLYPDPKIGIAFRNYPYIGANKMSLSDKAYNLPGMTGVEYSISQEIPYPEKIKASSEVIRAEGLKYEYLTESMKNRIGYSFLNTIVRLKSSQKKMEYNQSIIKLFSSLKNIESYQVSTGKTNISNVLSFQVKETLSESRQIELDTEIQASISELDYFKTTDKLKKENVFDVNIEDYFLGKTSILKEQSIFSLLEESPDYKTIQAQIKKNKLEQKVASIQHYPDTEVFVSLMKRRNRIFMIQDGPLDYGIGDMPEFRGDLFSFGVNMRVPVWSLLKNKSLRSKTKNSILSSSKEQEKILLSIHSGLKKELNNWKGIEKQLELYDKKLIPQLEKTISIMNSSYSSGRIELKDISIANIELLELYIKRQELLEKKYYSMLTALYYVNRIL